MLPPKVLAKNITSKKKKKNQNLLSAWKSTIISCNCIGSLPPFTLLSNKQKFPNNTVHFSCHPSVRLRDKMSHCEEKGAIAWYCKQGEYLLVWLWGGHRLFKWAHILITAQKCGDFSPCNRYHHFCLAKIRARVSLGQNRTNTIQKHSRRRLRHNTQ